jgi:hypothetical protein
MIRKNHVFVVNVVVIDSTWETMGIAKIRESLVDQ